jgi:hypothetical protein
VVVLATEFDAPSEPGALAAGTDGGDESLDGDGGRDRLQIAFGASGNLGLGLLPDVAAGGSVALGLRFARLWPLWIDASLWPASSELDVAGRGARLQAAQLGAALCPELLASTRSALALCAGGQVVAIRARGAGLSVERAAVRGLGQLNAELAFALELWPDVQARLGLGAALALGRPGFFYERLDGGRRILHRPARTSTAPSTSTAPTCAAPAPSARTRAPRSRSGSAPTRTPTAPSLRISTTWSWRSTASERCLSMTA